MAHHEPHDDHARLNDEVGQGHDNTEGNRQYYPQGWYLPLVGLFVVAFFFAFGGGSLLGISGTDKWGKHEVCHMENCDGHCGMDHAEACCADGTCDKCKEHHEGAACSECGGKDCKGHEGTACTECGGKDCKGHHDGGAMHSHDSTNAGDSAAPKPAEAGHEGHSH